MYTIVQNSCSTGTKTRPIHVQAPCNQDYNIILLHALLLKMHFQCYQYSSLERDHTTFRQLNENWEFVNIDKEPQTYQRQSAARTWLFSSTNRDALLSRQPLGVGVGGGWGVGVEVVEERCLPSLGEDTLISSLSRRIMVVFLAFLSPSSRDLSVSTSTSNCKHSRNQDVILSHKHKNYFTKAI